MLRDKIVHICCGAALTGMSLLVGLSSAEPPRALTLSEATGAASLNVLPAKAPPAGVAATKTTHGHQKSGRGPRVSDEWVMTNTGELRRLVSTGHDLSSERGVFTGVLCAWAEPDNAAFRSELSALLGGVRVDYYDARFDTPTVLLMRGYAAVFTWVNYAYYDSHLMGDRLADYVDSGGKVILGQWCYHTGATNWLDGRIMTEDYCPITADASLTTSGSYAGDGLTCIHFDVDTYASAYRDRIDGVQGTGVLDGTYQDGLPTHGHRFDRAVFYSAGNTGGTYGSGQWAKVVANMVDVCSVIEEWVACCDDATGICHDNWTAADCFDIGGRWEFDTLCAELEPTCGQLQSACCWGDEPPHYYECGGDMLAADCLALGATTEWHPWESCHDPTFECPGAPSYCDPCYINLTDDWIAEVQFNEINNVTGPEGGGCSYGDYRAQQASVARGAVVPMTVGVGTSPPGEWTQCVSVWIDWNQDYVFDAAERTDGECGQEAGTEVWYTSFDVTVPTTALPGETTMRVVEKYNTWPPHACDASTYGEVEDYTVVVGAASGACCTGAGCDDDVLEPDCAGDFLGQGSACDLNDCNSNGTPDTCDIAAGTSLDCNQNAIPDECELEANDCNSNGVPDDCDIAAGTSSDCNSNQMPDDCELPFDPDCNTNGILDECEDDCNSNGMADECDIHDCETVHGGAYWCQDCQPDGIPDGCQLEGNDCNSNLIPDDVDVACCDGSYWCLDCNENGIPDGCEIDCNSNLIPADCDIDTGAALDCDGNSIPDSCDLAECDGAPWCSDCNSNGSPDVCDLVEDCNNNDIPDECDVADGGGSEDCQNDGAGDGIPDECQLSEAPVRDRDLPCTAPDATLTIDILTDNYPGETTWTLSERGVSLIASGGPYEDQGTLYSVEIPVCSDSCYDFTIFDSYGDGICCYYGSGYYEIHLDGALVAEGGEFESSDFVPGIGSGCPEPALPLVQPPNQTNGMFSDLDCPLCDTGMQIVAENVNLPSANTVGMVRFWGGYYPDDTPLDPDAFTLVIREDAGGVPGAELASFGPMPATSKELTGVSVFGVSEWVYTIEFPLMSMESGPVHFEIYNDTTGSADQWFWEAGSLDPGLGIIGEAFTFTLPEEPWSYNDDRDMAWELHGRQGAPVNDCNTNEIPDDCELICDFDGDGLVDGADYEIILASFGHSFGDGEFEPCADFDDDNVVTLADYQKWLMCYRDAAGDRLPGISTGSADAPGQTGDTGAIGSIDAVRR